MKISILLLIGVVATLLFSNCATNNYAKLLYDANIKEIKEIYKLETERFVEQSKYDRNEERLNFLINKIVTKKGFDIVFLLEFKNPPMYEYSAFLWNNKKIYELSGNNQYVEKYWGSVSKKHKHIDDYILLVEKWNENNIHAMSYEKPLSYDESEGKRKVVATRMIFKDKKCIDVETIIFDEIDFDSTITPRIIE
jgi:hypothetical protein